VAGAERRGDLRPYRVQDASFRNEMLRCAHDNQDGARHAAPLLVLLLQRSAHGTKNRVLMEGNPWRRETRGFRTRGRGRLRRGTRSA
jgi:hypothetical protein